MARTALAREATLRTSLARAITVATFTVALGINAVDMTGLSLAGKIAIRARSAVTIAVGALGVAFGIVSFAVDMTGGRFALEFALLALPADAVCPFAVTMSPAAE